MSIQSVSFGATTKNGNQYKKTSVGKYIGATYGLVAATASSILVLNMPKTSVIRKFIPLRKKLINSGFSKIEAKKLINNSAKCGFVGGIIGVIAGYTAIGVIGDAIVNKIRAKKADKRAEMCNC